jgi:hypothetical protein
MPGTLDREYRFYKRNFSYLAGWGLNGFLLGLELVVDSKLHFFQIKKFYSRRWLSR